MARRIVAFRAHVTCVEERYKLGQDEKPGMLPGMLQGLEEAGEDALKEWMERANEGKLGE